MCMYINGEFSFRMTSCNHLEDIFFFFPCYPKIPVLLQAKQRATIRWLLTKAYNNRVPDQLRDPFYTDHDGNQQLKPQIVVGLGNASIYCQVLANIYSDPNYQSLNHWSILQTLSRKGVPILEERAGETPLTETVLIQTNPIRIVS